MYSIKKIARFKSFFKDVAESVSGTEQDFTEGRLSRAILLLSIPALLEMIMESFQAIITGLVISIVIGIPGALFASRLLEIMGASQPIIDNMAGYTRLMLGGNIVIMMIFIINAIFRSAGDAALAIKVLWIGN